MAAIPFLQEFVREKHDDWVVRCEQGLACMRLAMVQAEMGDHEAAARDYLTVRDIYRGLVADNPTYAKNRYKLGAILNNLGNVLSLLGRRPEARKAFDESIRVKEQLVTDFPDDPEYRRFLSVGYHNLAGMLNDLGQPAEAEAIYRKSLGMRQAPWPGTRRAWTSATTWRWPIKGWASSCTNTASLTRPSAICARHCRSGRSSSPTTPTCAASGTTWCAVIGALGDFLGDGNRPGEAESALRQALATFDQFAADFSLVPQYREEFARTATRLGRVLARSEKKWKLKRPFVKPSPCGKNWSPIFPIPRTIAWPCWPTPWRPRTGTPVGRAGRVGSGSR